MVKINREGFYSTPLFGELSEILPKSDIPQLTKKEVTLFAPFNGISGARLAIEQAGLTVTEHYISEIDSYANTVTMRHYPDSIQLGDITKWRDWNLDKIKGVDFMIFGSPCFVAGTKVITSTGYKNIEDVLEGDLVLTHKNRFMPVLKTGYTYSPTFVLNVQGSLPTETTAEHPYYVREMKRQFHNPKRAYIRHFSSLKWKPCKELSSSDYVSFPILSSDENILGLDMQDCWLLGRYLADGHFIKKKRINRKNSFHYQFFLSVGSTKLDFVKKKITKYHYTAFQHTTSTYRVIISSMALVHKVIASGIGKGALNKTIPLSILNLPVPLLKEFIDGYMSGDGYYVPTTDKYIASSVSKELIMSLSLAVAKVYKVNSNMYSYKKSDTCVIEGRTVSQHRSYELHFRKQMQPQSHAIVMGDFIHSPVKSVVSTNNVKQVFNLEVAEDNSYTANNAVVHNCTDLSIAKKDREGLKGEHSGLFWDAYELWKIIKPTYWIIENVASMSNEEMDVITKCMGVAPRYINSALVSAQNRQRLYWTNIPVGDIPDEGIMLQDILESGEAVTEKSYSMTTNNYRPADYFEKGKGALVFEKTLADRDKSFYIDASYHKGDNSGKNYFEKGKRQIVFQSVQIGTVDGKNSQGSRVYLVQGKSISLCANGGGMGAKTGLYKVDLPDGDYVIRKLTPLECERLQTFPDGWTEGISKTQRYKCLGNSFTVKLFVHMIRQTFNKK